MSSIINELLDGNKRFASETNDFPRLDKERRLQGLNGQSPKAIIVGCADSRIPPEYIFDQGLGDLFVLRVAGNIVDPAIIGSIEYAVDHLETSVIMILSHTNCGAVGAALDCNPEDAPGSIGALIKAIKPAVENVKDMDGDLQDNATKENARLIAKALESEGPIISNAFKAGKVEIIAAYYDISSGLVEIL